MSSPPIPIHILSKSTFLRGCQCPKSLYLYKKNPELRGEISDSQQMIFDTGTNVGILARDLFPGGVDASPIDTFHYQDSVLLTQELIKKKTKIIYEACFQFEGVLCAVDILVLDGKKWKCYEVKSSVEVKEVNFLDASLQYYVLTNSGINVDDISIVHINNQYVREGELDLKRLFTIESVKDEVLERQSSIKEKIEVLKSVVASKTIPASDIGPHCSDPYTCDFITHCWSHIPEVSVFDLVRLKSTKKFDLYNDGIINLKDLPIDYQLTDGQQMQVECYLQNKSFIDKQSIKAFLSDLSYPIYFLDFETMNPAVPLFNGTKAYQQLPFQYSLHFKGERNGEIKHLEFLAQANHEDPRLLLIETLLQATANKGTILTYNQTFEITMLKQLAIAFPKYEREIEERISRVADLMIPFQKRWYYVPAMNGSYSIKAVLPSIIPEMSYDHLEIGDGGTASAAFMSLYRNTNQEEVNKIRIALLEYCKLDTYAMVKLLEHLENI